MSGAAQRGEFDIVKVFYAPDTLRDRLRTLGWNADVHASGRFFIFGSVRPSMLTEDVSDV